MTVFCTKNAKLLFSGFRYSKFENTKLFYISDSSVDRIEALNISDGNINGLKLEWLSEKAGETGFIYFSNGVHCLYYISKTGIHIMSSFGRWERITENPEFQIRELMSGYVYMDFSNDIISYWINNPLDIIEKKQNTFLFHDKEYIKRLSSYGRGNADGLLDCKAEYELKYNNTKSCLKAFVFIYCAKIINSTRLNIEQDLTFKERIERKKTNTYNIIQVDTLYDESIKSINPFSVSGHFRNQPYGDGREKNKLIYIDSFMKMGYTRRATKEIENI